MIELTDGNMVQMIPMLHAIVGDMNSTVATQNHVARISLVDPERVMIDMNSIAASVAGESFTTIF